MSQWNWPLTSYIYIIILSYYTFLLNGYQSVSYGHSDLHCFWVQVSIGAKFEEILWNTADGASYIHRDGDRHTDGQARDLMPPVLVDASAQAGKQFKHCTYIILHSPAQSEGTMSKAHVWVKEGL